jgi:hypothetical protein
VISLIETYDLDMLGPTASLVIALLGATIYATSGAVIGSMNADWFGLDRNANALLPLLGVGAGLVVIAFASSTLNRRLREIGKLGRATQVLLVVGPLLFVLSFVIDLAIIGTLAVGAGLVCLAVAVVRRKLVSATDRAFIILSAVGSLTWNTETLSAFLLVGVGLIWAILSIRLLRSSTDSESALGLSGRRRPF